MPARDGTLRVLRAARDAGVQSSLQLFTAMLNGTMKVVPRQRFGIADVRDVAELHMTPMATPGRPASATWLSRTVPRPPSSGWRRSSATDSDRSPSGFRPRRRPATSAGAGHPQRPRETVTGLPTASCRDDHHRNRAEPGRPRTPRRPRVSLARRTGGCRLELRRRHLEVPAAVLGPGAADTPVARTCATARNCRCTACARLGRAAPGRHPRGQSRPDTRAADPQPGDAVQPSTCRHSVRCGSRRRQTLAGASSYRSASPDSAAVAVADALPAVENDGYA